MVIADFYTTDENGDDVLIPKGETKSINDLVQCIKHNKGTENTPVKLFVNMVQEGIKWEWFDTYQEYLKQKKYVEDYNSSLQPDPEGVAPTPMDMPTEPKELILEANEAVIQKAVDVILKEVASTQWLHTLETKNGNS